MCLYLWDYTINRIENEDENPKQSHRYDINRRRSRHGHNYGKCKNCLSMMMPTCIKQNLSNIWSSIYEKLKQHLGWVEKNGLLIKKVSILFSTFRQVQTSKMKQKYSVPTRCFTFFNLLVLKYWDQPTKIYRLTVAPFYLEERKLSLSCLFFSSNSKSIARVLYTFWVFVGSH